MKRIQRKRERGWRKPEGAIYVGRGSIWGNPFKVDSKSDYAPTVKAATGAYADWLAGFAFQEVEPERREDILRRLRSGELRGKVLMCWCREDEPWCHANYLLKLANPPREIVTIQGPAPVLSPNLLRATL